MVSWYTLRLFSFSRTSPSVSGIFIASTIPLIVSEAMPPLAPGSIATMEGMSQITLESQGNSDTFRQCLKLRSTGVCGPRG